MLLTKFHIIWPRGFRGKAVLEIDQKETRIAYDGSVGNDRSREWKFRVASKIHFILAGLASNSCKASRNLKTLATITGYSFKIS
jgi:hypothetical protein